MQPANARSASLAPLVREDLNEQVRARIAHAIYEGALAPGEHLVEDQLAASLGISRAPVRDALRALERDGLVESGGRRGKFVAMVSPHDAWEIYTLRAALEGMAFHLAAGQVSEQALAELTEIVEQMRQRSRAADVQGLVQLDTRFHESVCRLAGNRRLLENWLNMSKQIRHLSGRVVDTLYSDLDHVPARHTSLISALQTGDAAAAEVAVRSHIDSVAVRIIDALRTLEQKRAGIHGSEPA